MVGIVPVHLLSLAFDGGLISPLFTALVIQFEV